MNSIKSIPSVSVSYALKGFSTKLNEFGTWAMQERARKRLEKPFEVNTTFIAQVPTQ